MWADFGRFQSFRVIKLLYRMKNDSELASGIAEAFNESTEVWFDQLKDRLTIIKKEFFGTGSGYWWHSLESDEIDELLG